MPDRLNRENSRHRIGKSPAEDLGIATTAYGVLSRGLLSGSSLAGPGDFRGHFPRFRGENRSRNAGLVEELGAIAVRKGFSLRNQQKGLMPRSPISPKIPSRLVRPSISFTRLPRLMSSNWHPVRLQAT